MWERIKHILIKEFIQIFRNPRMRPMVLFMPVFQVIIFGYAVTTDVRHVLVGIYDQDRTVASREVIARFARSGYFDLAAWVEREAEVADLIDRAFAEYYSSRIAEYKILHLLTSFPILKSTQSPFTGLSYLSTLCH